jgi:hypothetical protein
MLLQCHSFFIFLPPSIFSYLKQKMKNVNEIFNYDGLRYIIIKYLTLFNSLILMGSKRTVFKKNFIRN